MSQPPIFRRLAGMETEYAMRFHPAADVVSSLSKFELYKSLLQAFRRRALTVPAKHFKEGVFWGSGGAIWFESERLSSPGGLIEGSTPECRGPRQLLAYQRAQDRLLAEAAAAAPVPGELSLIKNCRDAKDNVYGAQENYQAIIAEGWALLAWRVGVVLLFPLILFAWAALFAMILGMLLYLTFAGSAFLLIRMVSKDPKRWSLLLFGRDLTEGREVGGPLPPWLESVSLWGARVASVPLAVGLMLLIHVCAFRRVRRGLIPLLITRCVVSGAGLVDSDSQFQLADKAPAINCVIGLGGFLWDRPIFNFGHFFKAASLETLLAPGDFRHLFAKRQRLQIGLGDSNMAETAEWLRVGTVMLVLDAIEAGFLRDAPRVRRPIRTLHRLCRDPSLSAVVETADGQTLTAVQVQRYYLEACQRFLDSCEDPPHEALTLVHLWDFVLDGLVSAPETLIGEVDWVSKKYLLDSVAADAGWAERKKIDLRYHELTQDGYFYQLERVGLTEALLKPEEIDRAVRTAPPDSPATMRGHFIREFADGDEPMSVNWRRVVLGSGKKARVVRLSQYVDT